jgi:hypothetical protein
VSGGFPAGLAVPLRGERVGLERSRAAMAAIPAQFEGVLRNHMIVPEIGQRDSAYYSVIDSEWPEVRAKLESRLLRG